MLAGCTGVRLYEWDVDGGRCTESHIRHGASPTTITGTCRDLAGNLVPLNMTQGSNPLAPLFEAAGMAVP